jgi:N-acetyltransferase
VPDGPEQARAYVAEALARRDAGTELPFAQIRSSDGRVVGSTRYLNIEHWSWSSSTGWPDVVEIGATWLGAAAQRTPVNTEAKLLLMGHAFEVWGVQRVWFKTDARNERSRAAIERLGARFEGVLRNHMPAYGRPGPRDSACYAVLPEEWPAVRAGLVARLGIPDEPAGRR